MPTRKKPDANELARTIVAIATGEEPKTKLATPKQRASQKGGRSGGKKRMEALTRRQKWTRSPRISENSTRRR